jgi:hypothetical protein
MGGPGRRPTEGVDFEEMFDEKRTAAELERYRKRGPRK